MTLRGTSQIALVLALAALVGCAKARIVRHDDRSEPALAATSTGILAEASRAALAGAPDGASGYAMLHENDEALRWRLLLVDQARESIDLQVFIWHDDASGNLLMDRLFEAADRGVKVRLLVDEFQLQAPDEALIQVSEHPNLEARIFNPWKERSNFASRLLEMLLRFKKLNQRMHNKLMVADGHFAIVGGRNIADEYFGLGEELNFIDLDLLATGPVVSQVSQAFDEYWNSRWAVSLEYKRGEPPPDSVAQERAYTQQVVEEHAEKLTAFATSDTAQRKRLAALPGEMSHGPGRVLWDTPMKQTQERSILIIDEVEDLAGQASDEVVVHNAYFIPQKVGVERYAELIDRGVAIQVLTNSLGSNDEIVTNSAYKRYRKPLLELGVDLWEMRFDPEEAARFRTSPNQRGYTVLHTKSFVIDRHLSFVGSLNLDPRAIDINTEMGMLVDDPVLAQRILDWFASITVPENAWRVQLDEEGKLFWESSAGRTTSQPAKTFGERVGDFFYSLILPESQL